VKISVSVPESDIAVLDAYARAAGLQSRSAALQHAIRLLRQLSLEADYEAAWAEWDSSADRSAWDRTVGDGLTDAAR